MYLDYFNYLAYILIYAISGLEIFGSITNVLYCFISAVVLHKSIVLLSVLCILPNIAHSFCKRPLLTSIFYAVLSNPNILSNILSKLKFLQIEPNYDTNRFTLGIIVSIIASNPYNPNISAYLLFAYYLFRLKTPDSTISIFKPILITYHLLLNSNSIDHLDNIGLRVLIMALGIVYENNENNQNNIYMVFILCTIPINQTYTYFLGVLMLGIDYVQRFFEADIEIIDMDAIDTLDTIDTIDTIDTDVQSIQSIEKYRW